MPKVNFGDVKSALAACHVKTSDTKAKYLMEIEDTSYFSLRVTECLNDINSGGDEEGSLILGIQLLAIQYAKLLKSREPVVEKIKKSKTPKLKIADEPVSTEGEPELGTRSEDSTGNHSSPKGC